MPCDTIQYTTLDVSKMQPATLRKALEALGFTVREAGAGRLTFQRDGLYGSYQDGKITAPDWFDPQELQQQYSEELVRVKATRAGWRVKKTAKGKLQLVRRV